MNFVEAIVAGILEALGRRRCHLLLQTQSRRSANICSENVPGRGILKSAYEKNVPVFVPAFTDSELGLDIALHYRKRAKQGTPAAPLRSVPRSRPLRRNPAAQTRLGIFTIGGGVPRNWSQQFGPYIELRHRRGGEDLPLKRYHYGLRICPEPVFWGGLSGSPYSEAISWGKFVPPAEGGKFGEVFWTPRSGCRSSSAPSSNA